MFAEPLVTETGASIGIDVIIDSVTRSGCADRGCRCGSSTNGNRTDIRIDRRRVIGIDRQARLGGDVAGIADERGDVILHVVFCIRAGPHERTGDHREASANGQRERMTVDRCRRVARGLDRDSAVGGRHGDVVQKSVYIVLDQVVSRYGHAHRRTGELSRDRDGDGSGFGERIDDRSIGGGQLHIAAARDGCRIFDIRFDRVVDVVG